MSQDFSKQWTPDSWKSKPIHQAVQYDNPEAFKQAIDKISQLPPLVNHVEVDILN
jgi:3-deoxy-7-phosphoheptulonate synthase